MLKYQCAHFVPWADIVEWKEVKEKVLSENVDDIIRAHEMMLAWKLRRDDLPAYVECTAGILQVMIREHSRSGEVKSLFEEHDLRLSYSTALIRFVNHVHSVSEVKGSSLYRAAKNQKIPNWLVSVRHDAAHGQSLPSLETLRMSAEVALQWLLKNYWLNEDTYMSEYVPCGKVTGDELEEDTLHLRPIFKIAVQLWLLCLKGDSATPEFYLKLRPQEWRSIRTLKKLCFKNLYILKYARNCSGGLEKCVKANDKLRANPDRYKNSRLPDLKAGIVSILECAVHSNSAKNALVRCIMESKYMMDTSTSNCQEFLSLIQCMGSLNFLIKSIFRVAADGDDRAKQLLEKFLTPIEESLKATTEVEGNKRKRKRGESDVLALSSQRPPEIKLNTLQDVLVNPLDYSPNLIRRYLRLVRPPLPDDVLENLEKLIKIYAGAGTDGSEETSLDDGDGTIYTLEHLRLNRNEAEVASGGTAESADGESWTRSDLGVDVWSKCPLGLLPHQAVVDCTLPGDLKWKSKWSSPERKRPPSWSPLAKHATEMKNFAAK